MRSRCSGPKPFGALSLNAEAIVRGGLLSGRQMRSLSPFHIARPSESWTSGGTSTAVCLKVSDNQNIDVARAMTSRATLARVDSERLVATTQNGRAHN